MNLYQWKQWWRYWRRAKGRHGVHSPFVYRFIEEGLRSELPPSLREKLRRTTGSVSHAELLARCVIFLGMERLEYSILSGDADAIRQSFAQQAPQLEHGLVMLIEDIHRTPEHAALWLECCADARVNLSLELWNMGLLFCCKDFKERQHFVLKYPV